MQEETRHHGLGRKRVLLWRGLVCLALPFSLFFATLFCTTGFCTTGVEAFGAPVVLAQGEVLKVGEDYLLLQEPDGVREIPLAGALVFLNGEEVGPLALSPITPADRVEVRVLRSGGGLVVEGWYEVAEVLLKKIDPGLGIIVAEPLVDRPEQRGGGTGGGTRIYPLAPGSAILEKVAAGQIVPGQDLLLILDAEGRVKRVVGGF